MTRGPFKTVDEYIASFPKDVQATLRTLRRTIRNAVPKAEETISYHMPTYLFHGRLLYFAVYKKHYSLFGVNNDLVPGLARYEGSGRGTVRFPFGEPVPVKLIAKIAKVRAKQNLAAARGEARRVPRPRVR